MNCDNHNNQTVGEWSDDIIDRMALKLKGSQRNLTASLKKADQNEVVNIVAEFLPEPIQDAFFMSDVFKKRAQKIEFMLTITPNRKTLTQLESFKALNI